MNDNTITFKEALEGATFECPKCGEPLELVERNTAYLDEATIEHPACGWKESRKNSDFGNPLGE